MKPFTSHSHRRLSTPCHTLDGRVLLAGEGLCRLEGEGLGCGTRELSCLQPLWEMSGAPLQLVKAGTTLAAQDGGRCPAQPASLLTTGWRSYVD